MAVHARTRVFHNLALPAVYLLVAVGAAVHFAAAGGVNQDSPPEGLGKPNSPALLAKLIAPEQN
ncbi:hypothetical protein [Mycolicibacterium austroafricanum]|uniref:hypothetical protein n=1 Tax=Mycolicibacterium austroafricanum TaxID=39687 RepID=UPI001F25C59C|nr:hypothetical protein [Mycolicibacterium austroafricanum]